MSKVKADSELSTALERRLVELWDAYKLGDIRKHNGMLTADYVAVHMNGSVHRGKPPAGAIAAEPMSKYSFSDIQVESLGPEAALVTYVATVEGPQAKKVIRLKFVVSNIWRKEGGEWKCRYFQATALK